LFYRRYVSNHLLVSFQAGFVNANAPVAKVKPSDFRQAAERACSLSVKNAEATFPGVQKDNIPYICMDLVYQYTLLVHGFGIDLIEIEQNKSE
jgi:apyrase